MTGDETEGENQPQASTSRRQEDPDDQEEIIFNPNRN